MPSSKPAEQEIRRLAREVKAIAVAYRVTPNDVIAVARRHYAAADAAAAPATPAARKC